MSQQAENDSAVQWFLRTGGETVFGPVTREGLIVWAEQGRILPGHEVSADRKKWLPAVSVEFLDMRWYVDDGDEDLRGPLNRLAAETLVKSGKVSAGAQIVAADEVDAADAEEEEKPAPAPRGKASARPQAQELGLGLAETPPPTRSSRAASDAARNTSALQQECTRLTAKVEELEALCETLKRNSEKDSRAAERRAEQLRQQVKKQEAEIEDLNAAAGQPAAPVVDAALVRERDDLLVRLGETCRERDDLLATAADQDEAFKSLIQRVAELEQKVQSETQKNDEANHALTTDERVIQQLRNELKSWQQACQKSTATEQAALARAADAESDLADVLATANARDAEYAEKIAGLEKNATQSPEEIAQFYSDQAAIYQLCKHELETLAKSLEMERTYFEQLKHISAQRAQAMQERKQTLMRQLGNSPADMTRLSAREQSSDPGAVRIRNEFDNLRFTHEREMRQSEEREREMQRKLHVFESEVGRLRELALEGEKLGRRVQELSDLLRKREHELAETRAKNESEREQFQGSQKALLTRIEALERGVRPEPAETVQSADAKTVKLASWMRFKH
ncbi:MAG: hypothetical protein FWG50_04235 [Kiritimatiellaeota bacterium]|nr:hypothetical protein [Kiritimatiellota bacterium]